MFRVIVVASLFSLLLACQPADDTVSAAEAAQQFPDPEYLNPNPRAPYSEGVRYGGLIFLAGVQS